MNLSCSTAEINVLNQPTSLMGNPEVFDQLTVMQKREVSYIVPSYEDLIARNSDKLELPSFELQLSWRRKICLWAFRVADHFILPREIVATSMSHYDRFMALINRTGVERISSRFVSLVSLTSLYLAVKVDMRRHIPIRMFVTLSAGRYTMEDIISMEKEIISVLDWKLHPPTQQNFVHLFLEMLPVAEYLKNDIFERAEYNTEISLCSYHLSTFASSTVAFASILLALEKTSIAVLPFEVRNQFFQKIMNLGATALKSDDVQIAKISIQEIERLSATQPYEGRKESVHDISFQHPYDQGTRNVGASNCTSPADVTI